MATILPHNVKIGCVGQHSNFSATIYSQQTNSRTWMLRIFSHSRLYATSPNQHSRVSLDRPAVHLTNEQQYAPSYYATSLLTASYLSRSRTIQESTELALAIPVRKLNDTSCWYFRKRTHKKIPCQIRGIFSNTLTSHSFFDILTILTK